ncbi:MAG: hypothetical protein L6W00_02485 [Lentisphaeria bacterium]|nr:MAG: hypothetical protein L6W00_02485 [Lentisphaeria bacterium]
MDAFANGEAELVVRVYRGFGCVEDLLVDGVPIRELAKKAAYFSRFDARMTVLR